MKMLAVIVLLALVAVASGQDSVLCRTVGQLVDAITQLLTGRVLCPLLNNQSICPGLRLVLAGVRSIVVNATVCPLVGN